jgi:hypothetical protein
LSGRQHEVMEAILRTVPTEQLEEGYKTFIGRVIRESEDISEKEEAVLAENEAKSDDKSEKTEAKTDEISEGVVVTGDNEEQLKEEAEIRQISESTKELRRLAGIE